MSKTTKTNNPLNVENRSLFISDNLPVLEKINSRSVDLIYLDPPFNSNKNYEAPIGSPAKGASFSDVWTLDQIDIAWIGQISERHPQLASVINAMGLAGGDGNKSYLTFMARRLLEMHRILKETGGIYLHCDTSMSHSLKLVMDCIFGKNNFRNEIVWERTKAAKTPKTKSKQFPRNTDYILFYGMPDHEFNLPYRPLSAGGLAPYKHRDEKGRLYQLTSVDKPGGIGCYKYDLGYGETPPANWYRMPIETAKKWIEEGLLVVEKGKVPRKKRYLDESKGSPTPNLWTDIANLQSANEENEKYPTQKPLALLTRIIKASSKEGDMVLDPFCGCATACVAAEMLQREWIGIDKVTKAQKLVKERLVKSKADLVAIDPEKKVKVETNPPKRTDDEDTTVNPKEFKHTLFGRQDGKCAGCGETFKFRNLTIDHIFPQAAGGKDEEDNLQLLCQACNSTKGKRSMDYLIGKLKEEGIID